MKDNNADVLASIIIVTYNSSKDIGDCIRSVRGQTYNNFEIIVVDNASEDGTVNTVKTEFSDVIVIPVGSNVGYAAGNNIGVRSAKGDYIVIINPDTIVEPDWLRELLKPFETSGDISITTSKILLYDNREQINTCANHAHFSGLSFCRGLNMSSSEYGLPEYVGSFSGCSFAIRREAMEALGGFDADFFMYMEDVDLSWRARLAGYRIMYVPTAIIFHKFEFKMAPWKEYYLERNRYIMLLKNYRFRTFAVLFPALLIIEGITWGFALKNGLPYVTSKLGAYYWTVANINSIVKSRKNVQKIRKISDKELIGMLEYDIIPGPLAKDNLVYNAGIDFVNYLFNKYYHLAKYAL